MKKTFLTLTLFVLALVSSFAQQDYYDASLFFSLGGYYHAPRTDYASKFGGIDMGATVVTTKGNAFMLTVNIGGGEARKDFKTSEGWIYKNDDLVDTQCLLDYGHVVYQTERVQLIPYGGIGITSYEFVYDKEDDYRFDKNAFCVNAGLCYDINLTRSNSYFSHAIRIKPYAMVSFYNGPLHVVPSFNVAVSWNFGSVF